MIDYQFILSFLIGVGFYVTGWYMKKSPPKDKNAIYGYKTPASMQSPERWDFAQQYASAKIKFWSLGLMGISLFLHFFADNLSNKGVWLPISLVLLFIALPIVQTENALNDKFGEEN